MVSYGAPFRSFTTHRPASPSFSSSSFAYWFRSIGGTIQAGKRHLDCPAVGAKAGDPLSIGDAFEQFGAYTVGK